MYTNTFLAISEAGTYRLLIIEATICLTINNKSLIGQGDRRSSKADVMKFIMLTNWSICSLHKACVFAFISIVYAWYDGMGETTTRV